MRVFLTGGSGFVGQHLIHRLRSGGHTVTALARSDAGVRKVAEAGAEPVRGDLTEPAGPEGPAVPAAWPDHLHEADAVVHAAARTGCWGDDAGFRTDDHDPTVALYEAAARAGVSRFVLISAAGVSIGTQRAPLVDEDTDNGTAATACHRVKLATENALRGAASAGMTLVILRPPLVWGPGPASLADAVRIAGTGRWLWIDDGRHIMDFVHVGNLADAVVLSLTRGRHGAPYYVTDGAPLPVRDFYTGFLGARGVDVSAARSVPRAVAAPVAALVDGGARLLRRPTPPPVTNWLVATMSRDRTYDIGAARADLGYRPRITFHAGLQEMTPRRTGAAHGTR
ncbi:NAD-dependent epimerase/dehydratase family protein [Streptomyces sp. NPDC057245]|uniref:NAD-dependent epimerase/dehydratase family protein n=1 Tax=Streptomyces TaxID=1883 RepID=UPI001C1E6346|nr:NAD(P)-dependent oxidoreductase [Streptomyces sp. A108]MBU6534549.1 NAD(P)-dependent oxidoreductase [Streptomyces sp. A108]